jgi:hypothetical protein
MGCLHTLLFFYTLIIVGISKRSLGNFNLFKIIWKYLLYEFSYSSFSSTWRLINYKCNIHCSMLIFTCSLCSQHICLFKYISICSLFYKIYIIRSDDIKYLSHLWLILYLFNIWLPLLLLSICWTNNATVASLFLSTK